MSKYRYTWDVFQHKAKFEPNWYAGKNSEGDPDWVLLVSGGALYEWVICHEELRKWWDIEGATKLRISLSSEPSVYAYKCIEHPRNTSAIKIQDESTGRYHLYGTFTAIGEVIEMFNNHGLKKWYLGVEILE